MNFTIEDVHTHLRLAKEILVTLERQGPQPSWDFPRAEMEARMGVVNWHLRMARNILVLLDANDAGVS